MNKLSAGFARVNITPMMGIPVCGYYKERIADGVLDELELNALAVACEDKKAVIISADLCFFANDVADDYRAHIAQVTGLPVEAIILHATHTHTGPELQKYAENAFGGSKMLKDSTDELMAEYFHQVRHRMADVAVFALADLKPARMGWAIGEAPNIAFIRRFRMKDGSVRTNPGVNNPDILEPIGSVDERVNVVRFDREGAESIVLVNFADHPDTVGGNKISGDWPALFRRSVEKALDNTKCVFINGIQGDVNHVNVWPTGGYLNDTFNDFDDVSRGYGHARFMGRVVTGGVLQVFDKVKYVDVESIHYLQKTIQVPSNMPKPEEMDEARYIDEMHKAGRDAELPYEGMMLTTKVADAARKLLLEHGPEFFEMKLIGLSIGEVSLLGIPGEPFTGVGRGLKESKAFELVMPACLTNGAQGYFPMRDAYEEGGYEAGSSRFKSGVAELIIEEGKALLEEL